MRSLCKIATLAFLAIYLLALAAFAIGTFGLFGAETDPLSGVYLIPLGLPWNRFADHAPEPLWPWLAAAAPAINLAIIALACRFIRRRLHRTSAVTPSSSAP